MKGYNIFVLIIFITLNRPLFSQTIKIINSSTGLAIENVALYTIYKNKSITTNRKGEASLQKFESTDTIYFQHPSFIPAKYVKSDLEKIDYTVFLKHKVILMDEFVISASKSRENIKEIPYMVDLLKNDKISNDVSQNSADLLTQTGHM